MIVRPKSSGKWVTEISPDDTVATAARRTLKPRLRAVRKYLKLAAKSWQQDPEYVHQLRVHSRRSLAALELYGSILPKRRRRRVQRWLCQIRQAAGQARNIDVLQEQFRQPDEAIWPDHLRQDISVEAFAETRQCVRADLHDRRLRAQEPIEQLNRGLNKSNRLKRTSKRLVMSTRASRRGHNQPFKTWAPHRFHDAIEAFLAAVPLPGDPIERWHRFRVRGKQLRYTMELVSILYDPEFRSCLYVQISNLQERLGELSDHATACDYLISLRDSLTERAHVAILDSLIERERERMHVALVTLRSQWVTNADSELTTQLCRYAKKSMSA